MLQTIANAAFAVSGGVPSSPKLNVLNVRPAVQRTPASWNRPQSTSLARRRRIGAEAAIAIRPRRAAAAVSSTLCDGGDEQSTDRSIGDVVQGLHGGKYQFDDAASAPGLSFAGQQFAESLYGGGGETSVHGEEEEADGPFPDWVLRLRPPSSDEAMVARVIELAADEKEEGATASFVGKPVTVTNRERTWERFYAIPMRRNEGSPSTSRFADDNDVAPCPFIVKPRTGQLAPRGGASNACDPCKPYSDSATLTVRCLATSSCEVDGDWWLVVGTEEEKWFYRLVLN